MEEVLKPFPVSGFKKVMDKDMIPLSGIAIATKHEDTQQTKVLLALVNTLVPTLERLLAFVDALVPFLECKCHFGIAESFVLSKKTRIEQFKVTSEIHG